MSASPHHLFQVYGVELEYMIVDAQSLDVRPISDLLLTAAAGELVAEVELGEISWSNELALHVVELKTTAPAPDLSTLADAFQDNVRRIDELLRPLGARLMPTAMHPWMNPETDLRLWPHEHNPVYEAYHRIFNCRGHGWANLQSADLNLPFAGDEEFGRLHAAIRLMLPILPALAASSPVLERRATGIADNRLDVYRHNSRRVPSITGSLVPEQVFTAADYDRQILQRMYRDIAPLDPHGVLQHEWLNSRGAIARFDRDAIEIRVLDVQECPAADLAICQAIALALLALVAQRWTTWEQQAKLATPRLAELFQAVIRDAEATPIDDREYLAQFGLGPSSLSAGELWRSLVDSLRIKNEALSAILRHGPLSRRILRGLGGDMERLPVIYSQLCEALRGGQMWLPDGA